jgi:hypothetical protein
MKKIIDILAIVLPALLLVIGLWGLPSFNRTKPAPTSPKTNMLNLFKMFVIVILLLIGITRFLFFSGSGSDNSGTKPGPVAVSKHSEAFNGSVASVLNAYYGMTEGFVIWDTTVVNKYSAELKLALDSLNLDELQKDTVIYLTALEPLANAKSETNNILQNASLDKKRESLNNLSDNLRNLLVTVRYDQDKIYWQECPMAFNDEIPGFWLSRTDAVRNPYLGTMHPKYKNTMLECGGPKDTINFIPVDTTLKAEQ